MAIARTRRQTGAALLQAERRAADFEIQYATTRDEVHRADLQCAVHEVALLRVAAAKTQLLHQSQRIFEQGEWTGQLLAWLSREQSVTTSVANIKDAAGQMLSDPREINTFFASYYEDLYTSRVRYSTADLQAYVETLRCPPCRRRPVGDATLRSLSKNSKTPLAPYNLGKPQGMMGSQWNSIRRMLRP